jgi:hypothetical protein
VALPNLRILNTNRALVFLMLRCIYQMIVGGFYSEVALQNQKTEGTVHTKHQELKQASKQASKQTPPVKHESLVATEAIVGARVVVCGRVPVCCLFRVLRRHVLPLVL